MYQLMTTYLPNLMKNKLKPKKIKKVVHLRRVSPTVWGSIPNRKFNKLFNAQKKILRVLFGDREKFLDKFRTCIRARPYPEQNLPTEFYVKEHSKPLFNKNKILNLKNLYLYHCANETFKILKFRRLIVVHNLYKFLYTWAKESFYHNPTT